MNVNFFLHQLASLKVLCLINTMLSLLDRFKFALKRGGCCTVVEHTPRNQEVMGSISFSLYPLSNVSLKDNQHHWFSVAELLDAKQTELAKTALRPFRTTFAAT